MDAESAQSSCSAETRPSRLALQSNRLEDLSMSVVHSLKKMEESMIDYEFEATSNKERNIMSA